MDDNPFLSGIPELDIRELYMLWRARCRDGLPPFRADLKLQETPYRLWPHLFYYSLTTEGRYFCVYNGTEVVRRSGKDTTGHFLEEFIPEAFARSVLPLYDGVVKSGRPVYYRGDMPIDPERYYLYSRILLPIRDAEGENRHVIGIMTVTGEERAYLRPLSYERRDISWDDSLSF